MKHVVYSGSRNLYPAMETAAKSVIANSSVDKVHFLIEDRKFPHDLPDIIECLDVSGQGFFPKTCANMNTQFTYMSLLRVCYTRLLPDVDKVLQLDVDTVCVDNIDEIWDTDFGGSWVAMVEEKLGTFKPYGPLYYNAGVALFDLARMRETNVDEKLIRFLNETSVPYIDQDALNCLGGRIVPLDVRYNETFVTGYTEKPAIVHFAGIKDWQTSPRAVRREYLAQYREMSWKEVLKLNEKRHSA